MHHEPVHHTIVAMDVAGSGRWDDALQLQLRADLRTIVAATLARQSLDLAMMDANDLGDGIRLVVPATISPAVLLYPFLPNLTIALRQHRRAASDSARLRLRVAVHTGLLRHDGGWAGTPLVTCARMLDAAPVRRILAASDDADLVVVVSQSVYDDIVRPGDGLDPGSFRPVDIAEKETAATVWVHVPGYRYPPDPGRQVRSDAPPARTPRARSRAGAYLTDRWTIVVAVVLGGAGTAGVAALSGGPLPAVAIGASAAAVCYAVTAAAGVLTDPLLRPRRLHRSAPSSTDPVPAERADDDGRVEPSTAVTG